MLRQKQVGVGIGYVSSDFQGWRDCQYRLTPVKQDDNDPHMEYTTKIATVRTTVDLVAIAPTDQSVP